MRIIVVANGYPTTDSPQWGCFERDQALALKAAGHQVSILYIDRRFGRFNRKWGFTHFKKDDIDVYSSFFIPGTIIKMLGLRLHYYVVSRLFLRTFQCVLKDQGVMPDVVYSHYLYNIAYSIPIKNKYGIPVVGIEHWSVVNQEHLSKFALFQGKIAYYQANKIIAVSNALSRSINRHFGIEPVVVSNMLGTEFMQPLARVNNHEQFVFVAVGSLLKIKGYELLIEAFAKSGLTNKKCSLLIIGGGPEREHLLSLIDHYHLSGCVSLLGRKTKQEIVEIFQSGNVLVLSSYSETFSVVCIEALSQGLPVIATKCGGPEEIVHASDGMLIEVGSVEAMALAMNEMYEKYDDYNSEKIAENCRNRYAPQAIAKRLTQIFEEVTSPNNMG